MQNNQHILNHFKKSDPQIYTILESMDFDEWFQDEPETNYFHKLCREIVAQQLAGKAAAAIFGRFTALMPQGITDPEIIQQCADQTLRDTGMSWAKVKYVKDLAEKSLSKSIQLTGLKDMDDETVITELTRVKGIGRWTAEMFLIFTLGRENVFSFGDLGLKKGLTRLYHLDNPTQAQIEQIVSRWDPYKSYGSIALWQSLEKK